MKIEYFGYLRGSCTIADAPHYSRSSATQRGTGSYSCPLQVISEVRRTARTLETMDMSIEFTPLALLCILHTFLHNFTAYTHTLPLL